MPPLSESHDTERPSFHEGMMRSQQMHKASPYRRRVRFCKMGMAVRHLHINDFTPEEIQDCWYSPAENRKTKQEMQKDIALLRDRIQNPSCNKPNNCSVENDSSFCKRGIECRMREASKLRQFNKQRSIKAVLSEQRIQWKEGICNPEYLAIAYARTTASSVAAATRRGKQDAQDAQRDDNTAC